MTAGRTDRDAAARTAYAAAGVDVAAGDATVERIRDLVESTRRPEVKGGLGGFGSAFAIPEGYRRPLIVASTDGVGTKTAIAAATGRHGTIGIDLVAMVADDVVCTGAEPLALLDYIAVGRLDPDVVAEIVAGVADGCRQAGCALVGGETAEHPGLLPLDGFDLAATCVGVVEADRLLEGTAAEAGDVILGLPASGLHANGFSLVRALLAEWELPLDRPYQEQLRRSLGDAEAERLLADEPSHELASLADALLEPTAIYARAVLAARLAVRATGSDVHGIAHITGGGLPGNVPRALPPHLGARLEPAAWRMPSILRLMAALGGLDDGEVRATFNGGLGMVIVVPASAVEVASGALIAAGQPAMVVGTVANLAELGGRRYVEEPGLPGARHPGSR